MYVLFFCTFYVSKYEFPDGRCGLLSKRKVSCNKLAPPMVQTRYNSSLSVSLFFVVVSACLPACLSLCLLFSLESKKSTILTDGV